MRERYNPASFDDRQERLPNLPRVPLPVSITDEDFPNIAEAIRFAREMGL